MLEDAGFESGNIVVDGWGNIECFVQHATEYWVAPPYDETKSMTNTPHVPNVVWAFAKKQS